MQKQLSMSAVDPDHDRKSIRDNLILTALNAILEEIDGQISVPKALEQNKYIWAKEMFKHKALQDIISGFTDQVNSFIHLEIRKNFAQIEKELKLTKHPDSSIQSTRNYIDQIKTMLGSGIRQKMMIAMIKKKHLKACDSHSSDSARSLFDPNDDRPRTIHELARMVKHKQLFLPVVQHFLVPRNIDQALKPDESWLSDICSKQELLSFSHKKRALEEIKEAILKEVSRRKKHQELANNLNSINNFLNTLENTTVINLNPKNKDEENYGRSKKERETSIIKQYKTLMKVDPIKAEKLIEPRAREYMIDWGDEAVEDHHDTLNGWHSTWKTNQEFEEQILNEERGYKLEMKNLSRRTRYIIEIQRAKDQFYIEALEQAFNQFKLIKNQELDRLEMILEDQASKQLREQADSQFRELNQVIESFIAGDYKCIGVKDYEKYMKQLRGPVKQLNLQYRELRKEANKMEVELNILRSKVGKLTDENDAKQKCYDWVNQMIKIGCNKDLPRVWLSDEQKKNYDLLLERQYFKQQIDQLESEGILEKILEDIEMSKAFSIIVSTLQDVFNQLGLLRLRPDSIKSQGLSKFQLKLSQILELHGLLKSPQISTSLNRLAKYRDELLKFRSSQKDMQEEDESKDVGEEGEQAIIDERYRNITPKDRKIDSDSNQIVCDKLLQDGFDIEGLNEALNSIEMETNFNKFINIETSSETEDQIRLQALKQRRMRIQDTLTYVNDRLYIDQKKFIIFLFDRQNQSDFKPEIDFKKIGNFFSSVIWINKLLGGCLDLRKDCLTNCVKFKPCQQIQCDILKFDPKGESKVIYMDRDKSPSSSKPHGKDIEANNQNEAQIQKKYLKELEQQNKEFQRRIKFIMKEVKLLEEQLDKAGIKYKTKLMMELLRGGLNKQITKNLSEKVSLTFKENQGTKRADTKVSKKGFLSQSEKNMITSESSDFEDDMNQIDPEYLIRDLKAIAKCIQTDQSKDEETQGGYYSLKFKCKGIFSLDLEQVFREHILDLYDVDKLNFENLHDESKRIRLQGYPQQTLGTLLVDSVYDLLGLQQQIYQHSSRHQSVVLGDTGLTIPLNQPDSQLSMLQKRKRTSRLLISRSPDDYDKKTKQTQTDSNWPDLNDPSRRRSPLSKIKYSDTDLRIEENFASIRELRQSTVRLSDTKNKKLQEETLDLVKPSADDNASQDRKMKDEEQKNHIKQALQFYIHELYQNMNDDQFQQDDMFEMFPIQKPIKLPDYRNIKRQLDKIQHDRLAVEALSSTDMTSMATTIKSTTSKREKQPDNKQMSTIQPNSSLISAAKPTLKGFKPPLTAHNYVIRQKLSKTQRKEAQMNEAKRNKISLTTVGQGKARGDRSNSNQNQHVPGSNLSFNSNLRFQQKRKTTQITVKMVNMGQQMSGIKNSDANTISNKINQLHSDQVNQKQVLGAQRNLHTLESTFKTLQDTHDKRFAGSSFNKQHNYVTTTSCENYNNGLVSTKIDQQQQVNAIFKQHPSYFGNQNDFNQFDNKTIGTAGIEAFSRENSKQYVGLGGMADTQSPRSDKRAPDNFKINDLPSKGRVPVTAQADYSSKKSQSQLVENSNDVNNSFVPDGTSKLVQIFNDMKEDDEQEHYHGHVDQSLTRTGANQSASQTQRNNHHETDSRSRSLNNTRNIVKNESCMAVSPLLLNVSSTTANVHRFNQSKHQSQTQLGTNNVGHRMNQISSVLRNQKMPDKIQDEKSQKGIDISRLQKPSGIQFEASTANHSDAKFLTSPINYTNNDSQALGFFMKHPSSNDTTHLNTTSHMNQHVPFGIFKQKSAGFQKQIYQNMMLYHNNAAKQQQSLHNINPSKLIKTPKNFDADNKNDMAPVVFNGIPGSHQSESAIIASELARRRAVSTRGQRSKQSQQRNMDQRHPSSSPPGHQIRAQSQKKFVKGFYGENEMPMEAYLRQMGACVQIGSKFDPKSPQYQLSEFVGFQRSNARNNDAQMLVAAKQRSISGLDSRVQFCPTNITLGNQAAQQMNLTQNLPLQLPKSPDPLPLSDKFEMSRLNSNSAAVKRDLQNDRKYTTKESGMIWQRYVEQQNLQPEQQ